MLQIDTNCTIKYSNVRISEKLTDLPKKGNRFKRNFIEKISYSTTRHKTEMSMGQVAGKENSVFRMKHGHP